MNPAELKAIIENPAASADNRAAAIRELEALGGRTSPAVDHLVQQLLHETHLSTLGEVAHHTVHQFLVELGVATPNADSFYQRWLHESPVAQSKMKQMKVHLANCFFDQNDALVTRLQSATAQGLNTVSINVE